MGCIKGRSNTGVRGGRLAKRLMHQRQECYGSEGRRGSKALEDTGVEARGNTNGRGGKWKQQAAAMCDKEGRTCGAEQLAATGAVADGIVKVCLR